MADEALKIVGEISALKLQPGDVIIIHTPDSLSNVAFAKIGEVCAKVFPGHQWLVMERGKRLEVARVITTAAEVRHG
jgi:hypothetical protein